MSTSFSTPFLVSDVKTLFISNLPLDVKLREIYILLRPYPGFLHATLLPKPNSIAAFAVFDEPTQAHAAFLGLNDIVFDVEKPHSRIRVQFAKSNSRLPRSAVLTRAGRPTSTSQTMPAEVRPTKPEGAPTTPDTVTQSPIIRVSTQSAFLLQSPGQGPSSNSPRSQSSPGPSFAHSQWQMPMSGPPGGPSQSTGHSPSTPQTYMQQSAGGGPGMMGSFHTSMPMGSHHDTHPGSAGGSGMGAPGGGGGSGTGRGQSMMGYSHPFSQQ